MWKRIGIYAAAGLFLLAVMGCGGLRYSQVAPETKDFRPKKVGVLPADVGTYEEARGVLDDIVAAELVKRKWFENVAAGHTVSSQYTVNDELRRVVMDYLAKLKAVNFSDPEMSRKIGELVQVDAFLIVNLDYWQYTTEDGDKVAKVGMGLKFIDAASGVIMWKASHHETEKYRWVKPELAKVAKKLTAVMIDEMPH
jgi:hypothetical protein